MQRVHFLEHGLELTVHIANHHTVLLSEHIHMQKVQNKTYILEAMVISDVVSSRWPLWCSRAPPRRSAAKKPRGRKVVALVRNNFVGTVEESNSNPDFSSRNSSHNMPAMSR